MKKTFIMIAIVALQLIAMPAVTSAQQVGLPNYVKALGLKDGIRYTIGAYTDDYNISVNYCTYELDLAGHLVSYSEAETVEAAYTWTAFFDSEGLPTYVETVFIDYWSDPDANGNPPVTTSQYVVKREQNGSKLKIVIDEFNDGVQATITRDDKGRIIEVENLKQGEVHRYRYPDGGNVPYDLNGKLAFPQVDMFAGDHVDFPTAISISDNPTTFTHGSWQFEVYFKIGESMCKPSTVREGWKQRTITVPGQNSDIVALFEAFHNAWPTHEGNRIMHQANPEQYIGDEFYEDGSVIDRKNGYVESAWYENEDGDDEDKDEDIGMVSACVWKRNNGHKLFAVTFDCTKKNFICFYDFDPAKRTLTPEDSPIKKEHLTNPDRDPSWYTLPHEGKTLQVVEETPAGGVATIYYDFDGQNLKFARRE
jgi:hypothetical protein